MKTIVLIMYGMMLMLASFGQGNLEDTINRSSQNTTYVKQRTSADELMRFSKFFYSGFAVQMVGAGFMVLDQVILPERHSDYEAGKAPFIIGISMFTVGSLIEIFSFRYIGIAGRKLKEESHSKNSQGVSFKIKPTPYGIGLVCRF